MKQILAVFLLLTAAVHIMLAANTGALKGYVKDPTGAIVQGATLTLVSLDTGVTAKVNADDNGFFQFLQLAPGRYQLTTTASGFRKAEVKDIAVLLDQIVSYDVRLEVGQVTEVLEVTGGVTALIEPERISTGANITPAAVQSIPLTNRAFDNFWSLTPGATPAAAGSQAGGTISAAGSRSGSMNQSIDGINNVDRQFGGPIRNFRIADAVREFSVITSVASADLGRQSGPQINVITKSGTNQFHGSAFWFLRNDALEARNFFANKLNAPKRKLRQNQFGGTVGGPIRKDKTFFFFSWESQHINNPAAASSAVVPTQAERNSVVDPIARKLVDFWPLPNVPGAAAGTANFVANAPSKGTDNTYLGRVDHSFSLRDRLSARYIWYGQDATSAGPLLSTGGSVSKPRAHSVMLSESHVFSPTFFAELRLGLSRDVTFILPQDYGFNAATVLAGVPGVYDTAKSGPLESGLPNVAVTGYTSIGRGGNTPQNLVINTYDLLFNTTKVSPFGWSKHTFKTGFDMRREEAKRLNDGGASGNLSFTSFANFAGTCPTCGGQSLLNNSAILVGTSLAYWYRYPFAFYFQDDIKVKRNLTLNIGVRYEYPSAVIEKTNRATAIIDGLGAVLAGTNQLLDIDPTKSGPSSIFYRQAPFTVPRAGTTTDKNNFTPIFGFAYTPQFSSGPGFLKDGRTVIRGGFRASYDETYNNVTVNQSINPPWNFSTTQRAGTTQPAAGYGWNFAFNQNVPFVTRTTQAPGAPAIGLLALNGLSYNAPTAYAYNWNFGMQREITRRGSIDVSYIGSAGHKFGGYVNPNEPSVVIRDPGFRGSQAPNEQFFPFPRFGTIRAADFQNNSIYNGLVITGKIHTAPLDLVSAYTYSHSLDTNSTFASNTYDAGMPVTRRRMDLERGNSDNDVRHRILNYFVFNLPFGKGKKFLGNAHGAVEQIVGGWQLAGVNTIYTGQPFTVYANRAVDFSGFNTLADRPDIVGSGTLAMDRSDPDHLFDPAYFGKVGTNLCPGYSAASAVRVNTGCAPAGRVGTSPRNGYFVPGAINYDMTVAKRFPLRERVGLTYRAEFFNFTNHTNFTGVQAVMSSGQFGQMTSAAAARVIQMTLRLDF